MMIKDDHKAIQYKYTQSLHCARCLNQVIQVQLVSFDKTFKGGYRIESKVNK